MNVQRLLKLPNEELIDRCVWYGITITIPYSQLESDAVLHGVSVDTVIRDYLVLKLQEVEGL